MPFSQTLTEKSGKLDVSCLPNQPVSNNIGMTVLRLFMFPVSDSNVVKQHPQSTDPAN